MTPQSSSSGVDTQQNESFFLSWHQFSFFQTIIVIFLWFLYNYTRIRWRILMPFEGDEWYQIHVLKSIHNLGGLFHHVSGEPGQIVPGHWLFMWPFARLFTENDLFKLSLPHFVVMNLFFFLFVKTNWSQLLHLKSESNSATSTIWVNLLAIFFISCNLTHIHHSLEIRVYGTLGLVALLAFHLTHRIWGRPFRWRYVLLCFLILAAHVYGFIMLTAAFLYTLLTDLFAAKIQSLAWQTSWNNTKRAFVTLGIATILITPCWFALSKGSLPQGEGGRNTHMSIQKGMRGVKQVYKFYYHNKPIQHTSHFFLAMGVFLMLLKRRPNAILLVITMTILPTLLIYWMDRFGRYWFLQKQFIWTITFWSVFLAHCYRETLYFVKTILWRKN